MHSNEQQYLGLNERLTAMDAKIDRGPPGLWKLTQQVAEQVGVCVCEGGGHMTSATRRCSDNQCAYVCTTMTAAGAPHSLPLGVHLPDII